MRPPANFDFEVLSSYEASQRGCQGSWFTSTFRRSGGDHGDATRDEKAADEEPGGCRFAKQEDGNLHADGGGDGSEQTGVDWTAAFLQHDEEQELHGEGRDLRTD